MDCNVVATKIASTMGQTGINVVTRVMSLLWTSIAVEFIAKGSLVLFPALAKMS
jgi:multiple antibiotic resistance protein